MWILLSVIYGVMIGFYNVLRQKASDRSPILFVIALTCSVAFLAISWSVPEAIAVGGKGVALFLLKSVIVFSLWVFELLAFKNYFMSSLQPISAIRVVISFVLSLIVFNEPVIWWRFIGVAIIFCGLILLNEFDRRQLKKDLQASANFQEGQNQLILQTESKKRRLKAIIFFIISCLLNEISALLDKFYMDVYLPGQMQFWFLLFVSLFAWVGFLFLCLKQKKWLICKKDWGNWFIYICGIILVVADRLLFTALTYPDVLVSGVSIIKQLSTIVTVILGGLVYKEPNLKQKLLFLAIMLVGIVIVLI